jgi:hypothetical protein
MLFGDTFISGGNSYSYLTSIAAYNYFNYGGTSLLVARVASGSFSEATSSLNSGIGLTSAAATLNLTSAVTTGYTASFNGVNVILSGSSVLNVFNNATSSGVIPTNPNFYTNTTINSSASFSTPNMNITASTIGITGNSYYYISGSNTVFYTGGTNAVSFTLGTISEGEIMNSSSPLDSSGALASGSKDNLRWEITGANTGTGIASLVHSDSQTATVSGNLASIDGSINEGILESQ